MSMPIILFAGILFSDGILLSIGPCILIRPDIFKECLEPVSNLEALAYGYDAAYRYFEKLVFIIYIPLVHIPCFLGGMVFDVLSAFIDQSPLRIRRPYIRLKVKIGTS